MAHNLAFENNEAAMMYVGQVPWHGLGTRFSEPPETAMEAMKAARLDWEVGLKPVCCTGGGISYEIPDKKAIVRLDKWGDPDLKAFGLVGSDYKILQNHEAFSFFDPLIQTGKIHYDTAGALGNGERVWVLVKVEGQPSIRGFDLIDRYLLLSTGHDGKTAVQIRFTPVRVVCQNTLSLSLRHGSDFSKVYHVSGMKNRLNDAQESLKQILDSFANVEDAFEKMSLVELDDVAAYSYVETIFPDPPRRKGQKVHSHEEALNRVKRIRQTIMKLFREGAGNKSKEVAGTLWAVYNGVIEYMDHHADYADQWKRLGYLWFGEGSRVKELAYDEACKLLAA